MIVSTNFQLKLVLTLSWQGGAIEWPPLTKSAFVLQRWTFKVLLVDDNSCFYIYLKVLFPPGPKITKKNILKLHLWAKGHFEIMKVKYFLISEATQGMLWVGNWVYCIYKSDFQCCQVSRMSISHVYICTYKVTKM